MAKKNNGIEVIEKGSPKWLQLFWLLNDRGIELGGASILTGKDSKTLFVTAELHGRSTYGNKEIGESLKAFFEVDEVVISGRPTWDISSKGIDEFPS